MGLYLPQYSYNPGGEFAPRTFSNVYCWFIFAQQDFRKQPFVQNCKAMVYDTKESFVGGYPPIEIVDVVFNDQNDCIASIYGHFPTWSVPTAPDPVTKTSIPLVVGGFKYLTAFMLRNDAVFAQTGAAWD